VSGGLRTDDGEELEDFRRLDSHTLAGLQDLATDQAMAGLGDQMMATVRALRGAPVAEPYVGPAIFEGGSAAVLFHEALGHRSEGSRLRRDNEDRTLAGKVGVPILPAFLSVYDDPTATRLGGQDLVGYYQFDDEGVPAARVSLVDRGVFKGFLLGRTPVQGFSRSNGHGRGERGKHQESRMANLVVEPALVVSPAELRQRLLAEVEHRHLPYGLRIARLAGGVTTLSRGATGLRLTLHEVYRVFGDGRPDQLVRGADLSGTPLAVLGNIAAATNRYEVFNGDCGANDSGAVPQSNTSPDLLVTEIEIIRKAKGQDRPPLLPPPPLARGGTP
jgi:predicted Zn-dependent protease